MPPPRRKGKQANKEKTTGTAKPAQRSSYMRYITTVFIVNVAIAVAATAYYYYHYQPHSGANTPDNSAKFTVVDLPGRGKGLVAARDIKRGETILTERPLFTVPVKISSSPTELIHSLVSALPREEKEAFYNLSYVNFPSHLDPRSHPDEVALAIFQTNAVSVGEHAGIFPNMARLNHGCSRAFNAVYMWQEDEGLLYVHALKDVAKGRELLTTYSSLRKPRDERRAYLKQQYGFECACEVCSLPDELSKASDARLTEMTAHYEAFAGWGEHKMDGIAAINHVRAIWHLGEEEGYWSGRGQLAADAVWIAAAHEDAAAAQAWARLAVEWFSHEIGAGAPQVTAMRQVAGRPDTHKAWGTRTPLRVGAPDH